jgi:hypothetical protein
MMMMMMMMGMNAGGIWDEVSVDTKFSRKGEVK